MEELVKCDRCRKEVTKSSAVMSEITYRDREMKWDSWKKRYVSKAVVKSRIMTFCSGECAAHEQMAMEG